MSCKKYLFFSNIFLLNLYSTLSTIEHQQSKSRQNVHIIALSMYLLFLYRCDPAGALFLRKFGPCSFGSIKWVTFRCLKPGLGSKWRWCGTPSNFLMSHKNVSSLSLLVDVKCTSSLNVVFTPILTDQNPQQKRFVEDGILSCWPHLLSPRVSCLMASIVSQYVLIYFQSIPWEHWALTGLWWSQSQYIYYRTMLAPHWSQDQPCSGLLLVMISCSLNSINFFLKILSHLMPCF